MLAPRRLPPVRRDQAHERAAQTRMILARERALEATLARLVGTVGRRAAQAYATDGADGATAAAQRATQDIARAMRPALTETAQEFARRLVNSPKCAHAFATKSFADLDGAIATHVAQHTAEAVVGISASLREAIRRAIERAIAENLGQEETAALIVEATAGEIAMARARRIARTEIHFAAMYGQQAAAEASPLAFEKVWLATEDSRTRPGHAEANGQRVPLDGFFRLRTQQGTTITLRYPGDTNGPPGEIINCFPGDARVSGDVVGATRHWYEGELVEITTGRGHKLAGTPNHPILTPKGWVAIGSLNEGGDVISRCSARNCDRPSPDGLDVDDVEPRIEKVFDAASRGGERVRVPRLAVNFHGDRPAQDVDVVRPNRVLQVGREAPYLQHLGELSLSGAELAERHRLASSFADELYTAGRRAAASGVRCLGKRLALIRRRLRHALNHGLAAIAGPATRCAKAVRNDGSLFAEGRRNGFDRLTVVEPLNDVVDVGASNKRDVGRRGDRAASHHAGALEPVVHRRGLSSEVASDLLQAHAGLIQRDRVVSVTRRRFAGHVFNLSTVDGAYVAGGIIAHNCRCVCLFEPLAILQDQVPPSPPDVDPIGDAEEPPGYGPDDPDDVPEGEIAPQPEPEGDEPPGYGPDDAGDLDPPAIDPEPPADEPGIVQLPERDLDERPFERPELLLWAAGVTLDTDAGDTPRVGAVVSLRGPNVLFDDPDFAEVDREVARGGGGFLNMRRAQVWRVTVPAGPALPPTLFQRAGGGWIVNSGISRFGLVTLRVTRVEKTRWGDAAPKGFVDPSRLSTFAREFAEERLLQLRAGDMEADEIATWLAGRFEADREAWPAAPWDVEAIIVRLRQTGWDGEGLVAYVAGIDTSLLSSRMRDSALQAIELVERPARMTAAQAAQSLGASLEGERMGQPLDGSPAPESVIRTLLDTSWTVRALTRWLEQLLAGQVRDEPGPGEPDAQQRVIVISATMDVAGAVPEGYTWET